jgi:hypothetical protein
MVKTVRRVVDNRVFPLGLDQLYREAMKRHESTELLGCARVTAETLGVSPARVRIQGYYTETPQLTEYFRLMRTLQAVESRRAPTVDHLSHFRRLKQVCESGLFGPPHDQDKLLPSGNDPLALALEQNPIPDSWSIADLTKRASAIAAQSTDFSLVALAALASDALVLAALRESVVLYATVYLEQGPPPVIERYEYVWTVDETIAARARRFVSTFNELFGERLPAPASSTASEFWDAHEPGEIAGRCVRIAENRTVSPSQHYHWAIARENREWVVREFWSPEVWTTERYRAQLSLAMKSAATEMPTEDGVPIKIASIRKSPRGRGG